VEFRRQSDYDTYLATRASQGFTAVYTKPMGTQQSGNIDNNGGQYDGTMPFSGGAGANPSTGLNNAFWSRIDYLFAKAASLGITVFLNAIGYDSDFDGGPGPLAGKSATEFQAYGAALGARYAGTLNLVWVVADDYFGSVDSKISAFLTGLRGAGDTHPITIENMPESTSRNTLDSSPSVLPWGTSNGQYNWVYSYAPIYRGIEQAYLETSPIPVIAGDGYFYQGGTTYAGGTSFAFDRDFRQEAWWALSSGARGKIHGDEATWQWPSTAQSDAAGHWWHANESANIVAAFTSLDGWHLLVPDTSSALVTAGRGTRAGALASGGGGGQYEPANTDSYVTASRTPAGSLAVIYMSHGTTITIDESKVGGAGNYTAKRMDPDSGAMTAVTTGTTYNSTSWGSNGKGDPDWVLVLQANTAVSGTAALTAASSLSAGAEQEAGAALAAASGLAAPAVQQAGASPAAASSLAAGAVQGTGASPAAVSALSAPAVQRAGAALAAAAVLSSPAVQEAGAPLSAASALSAAVAGQGGAVLAAASSLSVPAVQRAAAPLTAGSSLTAGAGSAVPGAASLPAASSLAAGGQALVPGTAPLAAASSLAAGSGQSAGAPLAAAAALSAPAVQRSGAPLTAASALAAAGTQRGPFTVGILSSGTQSGVNSSSVYAPTGATSTSSGVPASATSP